jgi:hypothetical protein
VLVELAHLPPVPRGEGIGAHDAPRSVPGDDSQGQFKWTCARSGGARGAAEEAAPGGSCAQEGRGARRVWFKRLQHKHAALGAAVYKHEWQYRTVATELLNIMTWVLELLAIGNRHTPETRLRLSHRATVADVQRRMDEAEAGSAERRGAV